MESSFIRQEGKFLWGIDIKILILCTIDILGVIGITTIDLHGFTVSAVTETLEKRFLNAIEYGEPVIRIIHGQGKHSEVFPVIKSHVRHWLETSEFAKKYVIQVFRGEDGSPYTKPNPGETIVVLQEVETPTIDFEDDFETKIENRRNTKAIHSDRLRKKRRQPIRF